MLYACDKAVTTSKYSGSPREPDSLVLSKTETTLTVFGKAFKNDSVGNGHEREYYDTHFQRDFTDEAPDIVGWPFVLVSLAIKNGRKKFLRRHKRGLTA